MSLELKIELISIKNEESSFTTRTEELDGAFNQDVLSAMTEKHEGDQWKTHKWSVKEMLAFVEGSQAYRERKSPDLNPYAKHNFKHNEWYLGWSQEEECDGESWDWKTDSFKDQSTEN